MRYSILIAAAALLSGCTHLKTAPSGNFAALAEGEAAKGVSYALPMVQYQLDITRTLTKCTEGAPEFAIKTKSNHSYAAGERFEVDIGSLSSPLKMSGITMLFHEDIGTLKSFNASADDKTGDVLADVARIGIAVASAAAGAPQVGAAVLTADGANKFAELFAQQGGTIPKSGIPLKIRTSLVCSGEAVERLAALDAATNSVETLTEALKAQSLEVDELKELAALKVLTADDQASLVSTARKQILLERSLKEALAAQSKAAEHLGFTQVVNWPQDVLPNSRQQDGSMEIPFPSELLPSEKFCQNFSVRMDLVDETGKLVVPTVMSDAQQENPTKCAVIRELLAEHTRIFAGLRPAASAPAATTGDLPLAHSVSSKDWSKGLFIRESTIGRMEVRWAKPGGSSKLVLRDELVSAPQLGRLRFLPFTNGPFENNMLEVLVRKDGHIEKFAYQDKSAAAATAASSFATVASEVEKAIEKAEEERESDIKAQLELGTSLRAQELAQVQHELDMLTKQKALLEAQTTDEEAEAIAEETARLNAEVALLTAKLNRLKIAAELEAKLAAGGS